MAATQQVFVYNFGSSMARYLKLVSISPKMYTSNTPDLSILRFNVILVEKSKMAAHAVCYVLINAHLERSGGIPPVEGQR